MGLGSSNWNSLTTCLGPTVTSRSQAVQVDTLNKKNQRWNNVCYSRVHVMYVVGIVSEKKNTE